MKICIYGASSNRLEPRYYEDARRFGTLLAERGHSLIFGGGAGGLMGACAEGASGAEIIGVAPRFFDEPGILYPGCTRMISPSSSWAGMTSPSPCSIPWAATTPCRSCCAVRPRRAS